MGFGVDRTFNERLTIGFDVNYDIVGLLTAGPGDGYYSSYGGVSSNYEVDPRLLSLNYHTEFAFSDNDGVHFYLGTFIGLRRNFTEVER